ncbi:P-loop containing nucleoside triphosphate hydrolase protein [Colletotrichum godetiae]|uniref:P-loop containing nucleoside triphosphate hydrolase protein n=1 Tax=Colletotrichum godetiae TaxID=1209918 RepID=A0AAJ0AAM3_9PEZI|nr:P-loop containing nucleoside triphosphate hydrolase protein [Colletotrichum godetiae]KAK1659631.1 P-loop containing nucleoside triphosphate hydrolase protein [Colletotrichum godetiae]
MPPKKTKGAKGKSAEGKSSPYAPAISEKCAIFLGELSGPILASHGVNDSGINIGAIIRMETHEGADPHIALFLHFPDGADNEDEGSGIRFICSKSTGSYDPFPTLRIVIRFHREKWTQKFEEASPELLSRFPALQKGPGTTIITFSSDVDDDDRVSIEGLGMAYINKSEPELEKFVNENGSLHGVTLSDFIRRKTFHVFMIRKGTPTHIQKGFGFERLPPSFDYPYGDDHSFNPERCVELLAKNPRKKAFNSVHSFKDANSMLTVTTQSLLQDSLYVWQQAQLIVAVKLRAYFVPNPERKNSYFVILHLPKAFMDQYKPAWSRLLEQQKSLLVWENEDDEKPSGSWRCKFKPYGSRSPALESHPLGESEAVLSALRPYPHEPGSRCNRKIIAVNKWNELDSDSGRLAQLTMRGQGYAEWIMKPGPAAEGEDVTGLTEAMASATVIETPPSLRRLHKVSFLPGNNVRYEEALTSISLEEDRERWRTFCRQVLLGIMIITAGPGYGKTTEMAKTTLAMEHSIGPVFCTAPTHVAVTNFAVRVDKVTSEVCRRYNDNLPEGTPRAHHRMVLRGYKRDHELDAFKTLLQDPLLGDLAAPKLPDSTAPWRLELSVAFWLLVLLRSPAVRDLHRDDKEALHQLQREVDTRRDWAGLRAVATGKITWDEYTSQFPAHQRTVSIVMDQLVNMADILATTPSQCVSVKEVYHRWWAQAKAVAIDEAANMDRGDLASAWGNKMLPLLCGGDTEQLPPTVLTEQYDVDAAGLVFNQFSNDGSVSAQGFLMASGHLAYRLRLQLRTADGLFDIVGKIIYPDIPGALPGTDCARKGQVAPIFIHCPDTVVKIDHVNGGKRCLDQVHAALNMASEFVTKKSVDPSKLVILSSYKTNVDFLNKWAEKHYPELANMSPASTIGGYQGRENDIVFVVMGTKARNPGPGFTKNRNRLNVLLTRQRCGLVIFGDINVVGEMSPKDFGTMPQLDLPAASNFTMPKAPQYTVCKPRADGSEGTLKQSAPEQYRIWLFLWQSGRVATLSVKNLGNPGRSAETGVKEGTLEGAQEGAQEGAKEEAKEEVKEEAKEEAEEEAEEEAMVADTKEPEKKGDD